MHSMSMLGTASCRKEAQSCRHSQDHPAGTTGGFPACLTFGQKPQPNRNEVFTSPRGLMQFSPEDVEEQEDGQGKLGDGVGYR